jgi:hypothetical protein
MNRIEEQIWMGRGRESLGWNGMRWNGIESKGKETTTVTVHFTYPKIVSLLPCFVVNPRNTAHACHKEALYPDVLLISYNAVLFVKLLWSVLVSVPPS